MDWIEIIGASRLLASGQPSQEALCRAISNADLIVGPRTQTNQSDWTTTYRSLRHFRA